mmetsp:Transcript_27993/g.50159  ORF Transcript_27993/g.50159 Transcript_27993/m.50159 type:complete len:127 (-) Transcript_27993:110-490(-)
MSRFSDFKENSWNDPFIGLICHKPKLNLACPVRTRSAMHTRQQTTVQKPKLGRTLVQKNFKLQPLKPLSGMTFSLIKNQRSPDSSLNSSPCPTPDFSLNKSFQHKNRPLFTRIARYTKHRNVSMVN